MRKRHEDESLDPEERARQIALQRLTLKPHTRLELSRVLRRKGIPQQVIDAVLDRLTDVRLIDDEAYAHAWVESRHTGRGLARRALAQELRDRGVDRDTVDNAVSQLDTETETETARRLVTRKLPSTRHLEPARRARRLAGMLARKGYSASLAFQVVSDALRDEAVSEGSEDSLEELSFLSEPPPADPD